MATTLAVRRRAVCALALLALLCGAGTVAPAEAPPVIVSVEVSCLSTEQKLSWRFSGKGHSADWRKCHSTPDVFGSGESDALSASLCIFAASLYNDPGLGVECPSSPTAGETKKVAFTMECTTDEGSVMHRRSKGETATSTATDNPLGESGSCVLRTSSRSTAHQHEDAPQGARPPAAEEQHPRPPEASAASPSPRTEPRAADAPGGTQTPSTPQGRSGTPNAAPPAGGNDATTATTTTTTTSSPSAGSHAKSNADGSATNSNTTQKAVANAADRSATSTPFVRAPLMLLLTAALACAAG
ncbi:mucin-like glycoprotein [Trypanosoma conorhini]|uniref:Mucin-like glycoprotein n=1 Tax=Trypanosoma conorhini TaxID=83891 RepID=A0A3R7JTU9_9TRYP|nr:mucin-like glycoprotein [Trypanosoma conorhini]RNE95362.1 mucin-like glycoprotein [Trypanosoma conorhini]